MRLINTLTGTLKKHPIVANSVSFGALMGFGDILCQTCIERKPNLKIPYSQLFSTNTSGGSDASIDWTRTARFVTIGTLYYGPAVTVWYRCLDYLTLRFLPTLSTARVGLAKMAVDQVKNLSDEIDK